MSYCQVVNYVPATHATDYVIAEDDLVITGFTKPTGQSVVEYVQTFWSKALRCWTVYRLQQISRQGSIHCRAETVKRAKRPKSLGYEQIGFPARTGTSSTVLCQPTVGAIQHQNKDSQE